MNTRILITEMTFRNGGPACSIFCMSVILLDQLKSEHAVDIFQRVRALQRQRPAMITSLVCLKIYFDFLSLISLFSIGTI